MLTLPRPKTLYRQNQLNAIPKYMTRALYLAEEPFFQQRGYELLLSEYLTSASDEYPALLFIFDTPLKREFHMRKLNINLVLVEMLQTTKYLWQVQTKTIMQPRQQGYTANSKWVYELPIELAYYVNIGDYLLFGDS
jgi:hypothetical protein